MNTDSIYMRRRYGDTSAAKHQSNCQSREVVDLVTAAKAGDQGSWNLLVDRYLPLVTAIIARYRLPPSDADDVNQAVWLRLVEHLEDLRDPRALPGWLGTIARNESVRLIRLRGREKPVDPQSPTGWPTAPPSAVDDNLIRLEREHALREAMLELPPLRRQLLVMLMSDPPLSYDEISASLGIPKGSIGPTRARALEQLRNVPAIRRLATA
jgi:RNA polymerase sigma factor (sigma-70 family)